MQSSDFEEFKQTLLRLRKIWKKELDDDALQSYWRALKDQPMAVFRKFVDRHERYGKGYPKPYELRPKEDNLPAVAGSRDDASFREGEARCIRNLDQLRARDPDKWAREVARRRLDRIIATAHPGSSMYEMAMKEYRPWERFSDT